MTQQFGNDPKVLFPALPRTCGLIQWKNKMVLMKVNKVWELVNIPKGSNIIKDRLVPK